MKYSRYAHMKRHKAFKKARVKKAFDRRYKRFLKNKERIAKAFRQFDEHRKAKAEEQWVMNHEKV